MASYAIRDDFLGSELHTGISGKHSRKSPSRQGAPNRRSSVSPRHQDDEQPRHSLAEDMDHDDANGGNHRFSLAHELAAALMPEPSLGSRLLADEFGLEFDEGAEGIDEDVDTDGNNPAHDGQTSNFADELDGMASLNVNTRVGNEVMLAEEHDDLHQRTPKSRRRRQASTDLPPSSQDPLVLLSQNLQSTDVFLSQLRRLDADPSTHSTSHEPPLERLASDIIRRMNETTRERESQVRELREYERELRKIAGEVGGNDILGDLDELEEIDGLMDDLEGPRTENALELDTVIEEGSKRNLGLDWESRQLGDEEEYDEDYGDPVSPSPVKDSFSIPPIPQTIIPTPANALPHLANTRTLTQSLVNSLTSLSEHAQVNGAATAEAGRKIRALKNKLSGWKTDWESAEKSRERIERWEMGITDDIVATPVLSSSPSTSGDDLSTPGTPTHASGRRIDGRQIVEEQLNAFALAIIEAGNRTRAIMAA